MFSKERYLKGIYAGNYLQPIFACISFYFRLPHHMPAKTRVTPPILNS